MRISIVDNKSGNEIDATLYKIQDGYLQRLIGEGLVNIPWLIDSYETNIGQIGVTRCSMSIDTAGYYLEFSINPPFKGELADRISELD